MEYKKYSAFVSSHFTSLKKERTELISGLLDAQMIPICMEHFTVTTSEKFDDIKELIDQSDLFILLLGEVYGSCDEQGVSWTEREFDYAHQQNKKTLIIRTEAYQKLEADEKEGMELSEDQKKQLRFGRDKELCFFAQDVTNDRSISRILQQFLSGVNMQSCKGWVRRSDSFDEEWQNKHRYLDLSGKWYHVHLKENDVSYMRAGEVQITQNFTPEQYKTLHFSANNYNVVRIDAEKEKLIFDKMKRTSWDGDYIIKDDKHIRGVYFAERYFKGKYDEWNAEKGIYIGIHLLDIVDEDNDEDTTDQTQMLAGSFNDAFPALKSGDLFLFRDKKMRYQFLLDHFEETLRSKT